jgi:DNA repair protein SbcC/Rad50
MRPIVLDMNGFASFREAARIDFTDADFFALVGPTGSGKSTVIDAMTFALYGSVPRWGRKGMVSLALAPTTARGTVKLVFEISGQRYVVARELRRVGTTVNQKAASLERLADPRGLAAPGDPTEVLAKDLAGVAEAVERLLGLSYEDFCQCVVLPQGQFADFLHAKASERQEILLRLLGAEHYRQMMVRANQRASEAGQRAETLDETLVTLGDATQEAQHAAQSVENNLTRLSERIAAAQPGLHTAGHELSASETELGRLEQDRAALAAVRVPGDVGALDAGLADTRKALDQARAAEEAAQAADDAARAALADGPRRAPLELARERRAELDQRTAVHPQAREEVARQSGRSSRAESAVTDAAAALEALRAQRDDAVRAVTAADQQVRQLSAEHAALAGVGVPDQVGHVDERNQAAISEAEQALAGLQAAEHADTEARAARDAAVRPGPLEQVQRDLGELKELIVGRRQAAAGLGRTRDRQTAADAAVTSAETEREQCQRSLDEASRAHVVAGLRPHLVAGEACPLCEQTVTALPAPLPTPAIDEARARLDRVGQAVAAARNAAAKAAAAETKAASELDSLTKQHRRRIAALTAAQVGPLSAAGPTALADLLHHESTAAAEEAGVAAGAGPSGAEAARVEAALVDAARVEAARVDAALAEAQAGLRTRHGLDEAAEAAAAAVHAARTSARAAQAGLDRAQRELAAARGELRAARDPLVGLGAPPADAPALAAAWQELADWAAGLARIRAAGLTEAREAFQAAAGQREKTQDQFAQAEADLSQLRADATRAGKAEQEARTRLAEVTDRIAELGRLLRDAPDAAEVTAQLTGLDKLEAAAEAAGQALHQARAARRDTERELAGLQRAEAAARSRLSAARDPVVRLGAPALDALGLLDGWAALRDWAAGEASARDQEIAAARQRVTAARTGLQELTSRLSADLAAHGVELPPEAVAVGAPAAVAAALERARAATRRVADRRAQAAELVARRDAAQDEQQVARLLGDLLRSDRFPRWLVTAAVDALVAEASVNLAALTNDQFDLTHESGEFYVVDHADADSRRSVRTLSGGETFQASLALALALSSQMSTLAAAGAARLDSIFLDEGFGTLDPETLDVVATTLETLAQGHRMVGVITHVAALAERVPVRYLVARDARTSRVVRESPLAAPDDPLGALDPVGAADLAGTTGPAATADPAGAA